MATVTLRIHGSDESKADAKTLEARYGDHEVSRWLCASQVWTFDGDAEGDAIVVPARNAAGFPTSYVVLRIGDEVCVVEGAVAPALRAFGYGCVVHQGEC